MRQAFKKIEVVYDKNKIMISLAKDDHFLINLMIRTILCGLSKSPPC